MSETRWEQLLPPLLAEAGITAALQAIEPLTGGVSSDIVRIMLEDGQQFCAKRALSVLRVVGHWEAPVQRNHYEAEWLRRACAIAPGSAPKVLAEDVRNGVLLLQYLPHSEYVLWKAELLEGRHWAGAAVAVAETLAKLHVGTWRSATVARDFQSDALFGALRLDPYLRVLQRTFPQLAEQIDLVIRSTSQTQMALVHGDVSPKNILISRGGGHPVLLDAECAWYGDPVFDVAFCVNHLVLKAVHLPALRGALMEDARLLYSTWLGSIPVGDSAAAGARFSALLPCLLLARIAGKSPVEYLNDAARQFVQTLACELIARPGSEPDLMFLHLRQAIQETGME